MKNKILLIGIVCSFWLTGCSGSIEGKSEVDVHAAQNSTNIELLDQPFEQIALNEWEIIYLSYEDFDRYLSRLPIENTEGVQEIAGIKMGSEDITITLNNRDGESLNNLVAAPFIDTKVRKVYTHSAYYEGDQPTIIVTDLSGIVLSKATEPLEFVYPKQ